MDNEIVTKILELKMDMITSSTKYSITGTHEQNDQTVLSAVVVLWMDSVNDPKSLQEKYDNFMRMDSLIKRSMLFDFVQTFAEEPSVIVVRNALNAYHQIISNREYQRLAPKCGYQIPEEFGNEKCYLNGTLLKKVKFYYTIRDKIHSIYSDLLKKGVFLK